MKKSILLIIIIVLTSTFAGQILAGNAVRVPAVISQNTVDDEAGFNASPLAAPEMCTSSAVSVYKFYDPDGNMSPQNAVGDSDGNYAAIGSMEYIDLDLTGNTLPAGSTVTINWRKHPDGDNPRVDLQGYLTESGARVSYGQFFVENSVFSGYTFTLTAETRYISISNLSAHWLYVESVTSTYPCECTDGTITLASESETDNQTICAGSAITPIVYTIGGGATDADVSGLPDGVTGSVSGSTFTIRGTPTIPGTYRYSVTTSGSSPCDEAKEEGTITVFGYSGGDGTQGDPFQIATLADLKFLSENDCHWNKHFIQTADIDASATSGWNSGLGFRPIGYYGNFFSGSYDGKGFTINALTIKRTDANEQGGVGMFGATDGAKLKGIRLLNVDIVAVSAATELGGLIGWAGENTEILQSSVTGKVRGESHVGGLVGYLMSLSSVSESYTTCEVSALYDVVGGLLGISQDRTSISNSYATGKVTGDEYVGGLVGFNYNASTISNCYSTGLVIGNFNNGGLMGYNYISPPYSGVILNSFWDKQTSGLTTSAGGNGKTTAEMKTQSTFTDTGWSFNPTWAMAECPDWSYPYLVSNPQVPAPGQETTKNPTSGGTIAANPTSVSAGTVSIEFSSSAPASGHIGVLEYQWQMSTNNSEFDDIGGAVNETFTFDGTLTQNTWFRRQANVTCQTEWVASNVVAITVNNCITPVATAPAVGDGSEGNPYEIATLENLYWIAAPHDVIAVPSQLVRFGSHYIQTADIDASSTADWCTGGWTPIGYDYNYFFSGSYDGQGHIISGLHITNPSSVGFGLFGISEDAEFRNLGLTDVNINTTNKSGPTGALLGRAQWGPVLIYKCYSTGIVNGNNSTGGLVGLIQVDCTVVESYSTCIVNGNQYVGGLVGNVINYNTIINCFHTTGMVKGNSYIGGLVGNNSGESLISKCYSTGEVTGNSYTGGLVGKNEFSSAISNCYSRCNVSNISGILYCGGLVGLNTISANITNCYSTGSVKASMGGLVGGQDEEAGTTNSYWDEITSGATTSAGGIPKTSGEMKTQLTFTDWDFTTIWGINASNNDGYPHLLPAPECTKGTLTLISGPEIQTLCSSHTPITDIVYLVGGGATGAEAFNLIPGVSGSYDPVNKTYTISGSPTNELSYPYIVTTTGTYCTGSTATATGRISVNTNPEVRISGNNSPICSGGDPEFYLEGTPGVEVVCKIEYVGGTLNRTVRLNGEGTATVKAEDVTDDVTLSYVSICNNILEETSTVEVVTPAVSIEGDHITCTSTTLTAVTDASSPVYAWYKLDNVELINVGEDPTLVVTEPGDYALIVYDGNGCMNFSEVFTVTFVDPPVVSITGSSTISSDETTTLSPTSGGTWESSDLSVATVTSGGVVTGVATGTATFTFTYTNSSCSATTEAVTVTAASEIITQAFTSSGTFTVPENVYWIKVQLWGGGGSGGTRSQIGGCGGGGGGAYSSSVLSVTPGESFTVQVGQGGNFQANGGDSWFGSATSVMAKGGAFGPGNSSAAGNGGSAGSGYGDIRYSGGNGAVGTSTYSGAGGSSAGTGADGTSATGYLGPGAPTGGGQGGHGKAETSGDGSNGYLPGGGGGGAFMADYGIGSYFGGSGADGKVIISWETGCSTHPPTAEAQSFCNGENPPTVSDLVVTTLEGAIINWYDVASGGSPLAGTTTLTTGTYYVSQTLNDYESARSEVSVTVNETPSAPTADSNSPVCENSELNLFASTITDAIYSWTGPNGFTSSELNPSIVNMTSAAAGSYSVTATVNGCTSAAGTTSVIVNAIPSAPEAGSNSPICEGSALNLTSSTVPGATYSWTGPDNFTSSVQNPSIVTVTDAAGGTYSVTSTVNGCISAVGTTVVKVNTLPEAATTPIPNNGDENICYEGDEAITSITWAQGEDATSWDVYFGEGSLPAEVTENVTTNSYDTGTLSASTTYYWKVVPKNGCGTAKTAITWTFKTKDTPCCTSPTLSGASLAYSNVCHGAGAQINLTGLLPSKTFTIEYSIDGAVQTPVTGVASDASGNASFTTRNLTSADHQKTLLITGMTDTETECSKTFSTSLTLNVVPLPTATLDDLTTNICHGESVTLTGSVTATGNWSLSITGGGGFAVLGSGNSTFQKTITPPILTTTYSIMSILYNDYRCTSFTGFSGQAVVTADQKPILVVHNPEPVWAPNTIDLTAPAVTSGSSLPAGTTLTYWKDDVQLTTQMAQAISESGIYTIRAIRGACDVPADVEVIVKSLAENTPPVLSAIGNKTIDELATLSFTASATDGDLPANTLTFSLADPASGTYPTGAAITIGGDFSWTPTEAQGPGKYRVKVVVSDGTATAEEEIQITVNEVNVAPVLSAIGNKTIDELATLSFTVSATDGDLPANTLTFSLADPASGTYPTGAAITIGGDFSWTPTEAQGPGKYRVKVVVSDGTATAEEEIQITVNEVNVAPVLTAIGNKTVDELATLSFTASATDGDLPANTLTFSLADPVSGTYPTGAAITTGGAFSWTPTEAQGPGKYRVKVVVSDGTATAEEEIQITVNEVNVAPVLTAIGNKTVDELATLSFTASATDGDLPANTLTFSLADPASGTYSTGAAITIGGAFSWTPTEAQGPGTYRVKVVVSDGTATAEEEIQITVNEVNVAPVLSAIGNKTVDELATLSFTASATDGDLPANTLTFSLADPASGTYPTGAAITTGGAFSWTPTEAQGPGTYRVKVIVSDGTATAEEEIQITVNEVNVAPVLTAIGNKTIDELATLSFTASATDGDLPANTLTFSLADPASGTYPTGAAITIGGAFSWTPTEAQGPGKYRVKVVVSDGTATAEEEIQITVNEVNVAPVLTAIGNKTIDELATLSFTASATDGDLPANTLTFSLADPASGTYPTGAAITIGGAFSWTPTEAQGPGTYRVKVVVSDGTATAEEEIQITVNEVNVAPVLSAIGNKTTDELATLNFTASATDGDLPANTLTFSLADPASGTYPTGAAITTGGAFSWTPTEAQGPGKYRVKVIVSDGTATAEEEIQITVNEVNVAPALSAIGNKTIDELATLSFTASATDGDLPANTLTFSLADPASGTYPTGAAITTGGAFSWTPTEAQGPGTYRVKVIVSDGTATAEEEIQITVNEVNVAPILSAIGNKTIDELATLSFTASATDGDLPANTLTFSLADPASGTYPTGAAITTGGEFSWTPTEAQGPGTYRVKVVVSDGTATAEEEIQITVNEVNAAPVLSAIGNKTIPWGSILSFTASATDQDKPSQTLTFSLIGAPSGASIVPETGVFAWTPDETQNNQSYTFKVRVTDNGTNPDNLSDELELTVTVTKRTSLLVYGGALSGQYSDQTDLSATLYDVTNGYDPENPIPIAKKSIHFKIGSQENDSPDPTTDESGVATANIIIKQSPALSYTVIATFEGDDSYKGDDDMVAFDITQEDAITTYTGQEFVGEQNPSATTTPLILSATVTDDDDGFRGDIRNARVQFYDVNTLAPLSDWLTPGLVMPGDLTQGLVSQIWNAPVPISGYNTFTIGVRVGTQNPDANGYYTGSDKVVVNVYRTDLYEFISGGGHIIPTQSKGEYASDPGRKVNFGFNVKWNKTVKKLQGNLNLLFRIDEKVYQIKANAMSSLSINSLNPCSQQAVFTSKANLTDVTLPGFPVEIKGNLTLQVTMTNNTSPGAINTIGFAIFEGNNLVYSSNWPVNKTEELPLAAGNLIVHNGIECVVSNQVDVVLYTSANPSFVGDEVIFEAVVIPKGNPQIPEGSVVLKNGTTPIGTVLLNNGKASLPVSDLAEGTHVITAEYTSTNGFDNGLSNKVSQKVVEALLELTSDINPSAEGESVTFTATLTASAAGEIPAGTVTFKAGAIPLGTDDLTDGTASISASSLPAGVHIITAEYSGNYGTVTATVTQTVTSSVSMTLTSSKNPEQVSNPVTFTATLTGSGGAPVGMEVLFYINETLKGTAVTNAEGKAVWNYTFASTGTFQVEARFAGQTAAVSQVIKTKVKSATIISLEVKSFNNTSLQVYPNPFSEKLNFEFVSPDDGKVRIDIYDMTGRMVETVFNGFVEAGITYKAGFTPDKIIDGVYLYRMTMGTEVYNGKAIFKR